MNNIKCQIFQNQNFQAANLLNLLKGEKPTSCQSSRYEVFCEKVLKFSKNTILLECYNTCATESLFNNVTGLGTPALVLNSKFCENFQNTFLWKTFGRLFIPYTYFRISVSIYDKKLWLVLFKHFIQERKVAIGRCSFNQNP